MAAAQREVGGQREPLCIGGSQQIGKPTLPYQGQLYDEIVGAGLLVNIEDKFRYLLAVVVRHQWTASLDYLDVWRAVGGIYLRIVNGTAARGNSQIGFSIPAFVPYRQDR